MMAHEILNIGALKIADILEKERVSLKNTNIFVKGILGNYLKILKREFNIGRIDKLFFLGDFSLNFLEEIFSEKISNTISISKEKLLKKFEDFKVESFSRLSSSYGVSEKNFKRKIVSAFLLNEFSDFFKVQDIYYIEPDAKRTFVYTKFFKTVSGELDKRIDKYSLDCAKKVGEKYFYDREHSDFLIASCQSLFNKLKPVHKFSGRQLHFLKMGAIFHDIGKFISLRNHHKHSYYLVKETSIFGLDEMELQIVANLCLYHNVETPNLNMKFFRKFNDMEKITIIKLTAILKLLVSLDRSKRQKFREISYTMDGSNLLVEVSTDEDLSVERWSFNNRNRFFKEVFGLNPILKVKRRYLEDVF
jgi:exopolyphosphatase/guanosine-5'-triphosphate,3'-diphosphate pyrophosphatase